MSAILSIGLLFILSGTSLMPQHTFSAKWWVAMIGIISFSYALDAMTKHKAKK